eukprot:TRINITY_DN3276_c0_g2_i3.p1 TRINITY_DN3276_c0_g2~~TRINITY_DN3276_c0_g2_i3.p1  ORF type:complete len:204 (+),score=37.53 TRINITY_DN3276_c0_g2_i3:68-679(+)
MDKTSASLSAQLSHLKLKKVDLPLPQASQPSPQHVSTANDHLSQEEKERIIEKHFEVNMDRWAHLLPPSATIPVFSLPLSVEQARSIMDQSKEYDAATFAEESLHVLQELEKDLEKVINEGCGGAKEAQSNGCFVKLSSRSPKDVLPPPETLKQIYDECFATNNINKEETDKENKNRRLISLYEASIRFMKVLSFLLFPFFAT